MGPANRRARHLPRRRALQPRPLVKASGLRWFTLALLAPVPWASRVWTLPFLTTLAPSGRHARARGARHKKLTDWARQALLQLAGWLPGRRVAAVADRSYAALEVLHAVRRCVCVVARLRLDARLFDPPPPRTPRIIDRRRVVGARQPTLPRRLERADTPWRRLEVPRAVLDRLTDLACHAA